jgi:radical SAM-linked protein
VAAPTSPARAARPVPGGPPPAPTVQRVLVMYAKRGRMRFASHRDVGRAFERAVRRAGLPMAHSAGFNPHPKISYAGGTPTGVASEAEYLTLALTSTQDPVRLRRVLDTALPDGIDVIEVREDSGGTLNGRLMASEWLVELPGIAPAAAEAAVRTFLAAADGHVERLTNKGVRRLDARGAVLAMELDRRACDAFPGDRGILRMVVRHTEPAVRPEDVLTALRQIAGLVPASPATVTRVAQGVVGGDGTVRLRVAEPAAVATVAAAPGPRAQAAPEVMGQSGAEVPGQHAGAPAPEHWNVP